MLKIIIINVGKGVMLLFWIGFIYNLINPYPEPLKHLINMIMIFIVIMHIIQIFLCKLVQGTEKNTLTIIQKIRFLLFGVFELMTWYRQFQK